MAPKSATAVSPFLKPGTAVEVCSEDDGFRGSWFTGKIVRRLANNKVSVEYDSLTEDDEGTKPLKETLHIRQLRPLPLPETQHEFKFGDEVDAYHNDGWWEGHITEELGNGRFAVYFRVSKERIEFPKEELRTHREWIDDHWDPPFELPKQEEQVNESNKVLLTPNAKSEEAVNKVLLTPKAKSVEAVNKVLLTPNVESEEAVNKVLLTPNVESEEAVKLKKKEELFCVGALVEVSSDEEGFQGAWFSATIVEVMEQEKFLVEYHNLTDDDGQLLREEIDSLHIRPPPPPENGVVAQFSRLDEVDALHNDGWWVGVISKVLGDSKYIVYFRGTNEELEFQQSELRVHQDFIGGKWVMAKVVQAR
ncbi:protein AGENET DOMAIN (AGD)-CONTAINING P1 isoform X2 [Lotus japonicus]|uniref:protein AGENET DOMAIN (AGD)-CONTAINING P1 isoform X2 n=1 Tax=Lotus japonicus TaxID=34305 RepID=UPI002589EE65|nr:protein AGENET DOMAIN (AGD)-CONTAINING P1 isoform X2 [Lotus japonicus]